MRSFDPRGHQIAADPRVVIQGNKHGRWGFTTPLPIRAPGSPPGRVNMLTWSSNDGMPHFVSLKVFMNNAMAQVGFIPSSVIEAIAQLNWQNDAGEFNAEVDLHFGQTLNLLASSLTVTIVTLRMTATTVPQLTASAALAIDASPVSGAIQPQRTFPFFELVGLAADGQLPLVIPVPNFSREFTIVRTNDPPAGVPDPVVNAGALNDIFIRVDSIPFGIRSQHQIGAGADPEIIKLFNGAAQVTVSSTGNPVGLNVIFFLDL